MQIFVKNLTGNTTSLEVEPSDTIGTVKGMIEEATGTHPDRQKLMLNHAELSDKSRTLEETKIQDQTTIFLFKRPMQIKVLCPDDEMISLHVEETTTIGYIKSKLEERGRGPAVYQSLFYGSVELENDSKASNLKLGHNDVLYFLPIETIIISVLCPNREVKSFTLGITTTIGQLKESLKGTGIPVLDQKLYYKSTVLTHHKTLLDFRIPHASTLYLINNPGNIGQVRINCNGRTNSVVVDDTTTLEDIREEIRAYPLKFLGKVNSWQRNRVEFVQFKGEKTLKEYGIGRDSEISIAVPRHAMNINVNNAGYRFTLAVDKYDTVNEVISALRGYIHFNPGSCILSLHGEELNKEKTLHEHNVVGGSMLDVSVRLQLYTR